MVSNKQNASFIRIRKKHFFNELFENKEVGFFKSDWYLKNDFNSGENHVKILIDSFSEDLNVFKRENPYLIDQDFVSEFFIRLSAIIEMQFQEMEVDGIKINVALFNDAEMKALKNLQGYIDEKFTVSRVEKLQVSNDYSRFKWNKTKQQLAELILALADSNVFKNPDTGESATTKEIERLFEQITGESFTNINTTFNTFKGTITSHVTAKSDRLLTSQLLANIKRRMEIND